MKIRFIEPGNLPYRRSVSNYFVYDKYIRTPSHGLMTLATIVKEQVEDVLIYSESISILPWKDILDADIIFISIFTFNANRGYELASYIRSHSNALIVFGGLHATLCSEETSQHCDYVLVGEGDELILEFLGCLQKGLPVTCLGVAYRDGENVVFTGKRKPPEEIDVIPDRNLMYQYREKTKYNTIWPQVHASRGCSHNCDYCALVSAFGRTVRTRTPSVVVEDIRQAIAFYDEGHHRLSRMLWITDDNFF